MNFICNICNNTYKTRNGLFKHNRKYHSDQSVPKIVSKNIFVNFVQKN